MNFIEPGAISTCSQKVFMERILNNNSHLKKYNSLSFDLVVIIRLRFDSPVK